MSVEDVARTRAVEINRQYERAARQLSMANETIRELNAYVNRLTNTKDFTDDTIRMTNEDWMSRASEMIKELMVVDGINYPTFKSVLLPIYTKLKNVYGIVLDQLRKEYRYNNNTLRYPSAFEAISDNDTVRSIFDSLLIELFPEEYFYDEVVECVEGRHEYDPKQDINNPILRMIEPLANKMGDNTQCYTSTIAAVLNNMDCSWGNLQTRYMNKHGVSSPPTKLEIILDNHHVMKKFKNTILTMLEGYSDL